MSPALMPILPRHVHGDGQHPATHPANTRPVGAGPFRFAAIERGERIVLERNPDYVLATGPAWTELLLSALALERGTAHLFPFAMNAEGLQCLAVHERLAITDQGDAGIGAINWLAFSTRKAPLGNKDVRRAIAYAIDRPFIAEQVHLGYATLATGPIVPGKPFHTDEVERYDQDLDLERANALLDAAGFRKNADGVRFGLTIDHIPDADDQQMEIAAVLKAALSQIGVDLTVRTAPDFPTWARRVAGGGFYLTLDIVLNWGDPAIGVHRSYLTDNIRPQIWTNTQGYTNPRVDELPAQAAVALDPQARTAFYRQFQQIVVDDLPVQLLTLLPCHTIHERRVGNVPATIWGGLSPMDDVYLTR